MIEFEKTIKKSNDSYLPGALVCFKEDFKLFADKDIQNPKDAIELVGKYIFDRDKPYVCLVPMMIDARPLYVAIQSIDPSSNTFGDPAALLRRLSLSGCFCYYIVSNHPNGTIKPTTQDIKTTDLLIQMSKVTGIYLFDHIIVGREKGQPSYYSMREHHKIKKADYKLTSRLVGKEAKLTFQPITSDCFTLEPNEGEFEFNVFLEHQDFVNFMNFGHMKGMEETPQQEEPGEER